MYASTALSVLPLFALAPPGASAVDVVRVVADRDTTLYEDPTGALGSGAGAHLFAGRNSSAARRRALLHFPLHGLPAGATVQSVTLTLHLDMTNAGDELFRLHRVTREWGEGASDPGPGGGGAPAQPGDATWIHAFLPGCGWAAAGGDFAATATGGGVIGAAPGPYDLGGTLLAADVQAWIDGTHPNLGWLLKHDDEIGVQTAKRLASREHADSLLRPTLTVVFTPGAGCGSTGYCAPAAPNSSGCPARTSWAGSCGTATSSFSLVVEGLPVGELGYFIGGRQQGALHPPGSQGTVCLVPPIARFNAVPQIVQGPGGAVRIDLGAIPICSPPACSPATVLPGETWSFQCWYRDGASSNFSDGLQVTFD